MGSTFVACTLVASLIGANSSQWAARATVLGLIPLLAALLWWFGDVAARTKNSDRRLNKRKFLLWRVFGTGVLYVGTYFLVSGLSSSGHVFRTWGIVLLVVGVLIGVGIAKLGYPTQAFMTERNMFRK
jgi:hypothetical protein